MPSDGKKILIVVPMNDFADDQYELPRRIWEWRGHRITVTSLERGVARGARGTGARCDVAVDKVRLYDYDAMVLVGGGGTRRLFDDRKVLKLVDDAKYKLVGAIGNAVALLALGGLVKGKQVTSSQEVAHIIVEAGANYTGGPLEIDEKVVTSDGTALEYFANALIEAIG